jgi:hypothetical protein
MIILGDYVTDSAPRGGQNGLVSKAKRRAMTKNVGGIDRILRIVLGVALIGATLAGYLPAWGWIGVVLLLTAAIGWCPAYLPFGFRTNKTDT